MEAIWSWELELPEGWRLGKPIKNSRTLFYLNKKVQSFLDDWNLQKNVQKFLENPPGWLQKRKVKAAVLDYSQVTDEKTQKWLVTSGRITPFQAVEFFPHLESWLFDFRFPKVTLGDIHYYKKGSYWYTSDGKRLTPKRKFLSIWDARIKYQKSKRDEKSEVSFDDIVRYSWSAVLETIGDDLQATINERQTEAHNICFQYAQRRYNYPDYSDTYGRDAVLHLTDELYTEAKQYLEFLTSSKRITWLHMQKESILKVFPQLDTVSSILLSSELIDDYIEETYTEINEILADRSLVGFRWDSLDQSYHPSYAPSALSDSKKAHLFQLIRQVAYGEISGHEAALEFCSGGSTSYSRREHTRFVRQGTQYLPFYERRARQLSNASISFNKAILAIRDNIEGIQELYRSGYQGTTSFVYGDMRFLYNYLDNRVQYLGPRCGTYFPDKYLRMSAKELRRYLPDTADRLYYEKAVSKFRRCFSYLNNVIHRRTRTLSYQDDLRRAKQKYLKRPQAFLDACASRADRLITEFMIDKSDFIQIS